MLKIQGTDSICELWVESRVTWHIDRGPGWWARSGILCGTRKALCFYFREMICDKYTPHTHIISYSLGWIYLCISTSVSVIKLKKASRGHLTSWTRHKLRGWMKTRSTFTDRHPEKSGCALASWCFCCGQTLSINSVIYSLCDLLFLHIGCNQLLLIEPNKVVLYELQEV